MNLKPSASTRLNQRPELRTGGLKWRPSDGLREQPDQIRSNIEERKEETERELARGNES